MTTRKMDARVDGNLKGQLKVVSAGIGFTSFDVFYWFIGQFVDYRSFSFAVRKAVRMECKSSDYMDGAYLRLKRSRPVELELLADE